MDHRNDLGPKGAFMHGVDLPAGRQAPANSGARAMTPERRADTCDEFEIAAGTSYNARKNNKPSYTRPHCARTFSTPNVGDIRHSSALPDIGKKQIAPYCRAAKHSIDLFERGLPTPRYPIRIEASR